MRNILKLCCTLLILSLCFLNSPGYATFPEFNQDTLSGTQNDGLKRLYQTITQQEDIKLGDTREHIRQTLASEKEESFHSGNTEYVFYKNGTSLCFEDEKLVFMSYFNYKDYSKNKYFSCGMLNTTSFGTFSFAPIRELFDAPDHEDGGLTYTSEDKTVRFFGKMYFQGYIMAVKSKEKTEELNEQVARVYRKNNLNFWWLND